MEVLLCLVVYRPRTVLISGRKDVLRPHQHSSTLIYSFRFTCGLLYIERTDRRLDARIKQHVPTKIRLGNYFAGHINNTYGSSIAEHLINNRDCESTYSADVYYFKQFPLRFSPLSVKDHIYFDP